MGLVSYFRSNLILIVNIINFPARLIGEEAGYAIHECDHYMALGLHDALRRREGRISIRTSRREPKWPLAYFRREGTVRAAEKGIALCKPIQKPNDSNITKATAQGKCDKMQCFLFSFWVKRYIPPRDRERSI